MPRCATVTRCPSPALSARVDTQLEKAQKAKEKKVKKQQEAAGVKVPGTVEYRPWNRETDLLVRAWRGSGVGGGAHVVACVRCQPAAEATQRRPQQAAEPEHAAEQPLLVQQPRALPVARPPDSPLRSAPGANSTLSKLNSRTAARRAVRAPAAVHTRTERCTGRHAAREAARNMRTHAAGSAAA